MGDFACAQTSCSSALTGVTLNNCRHQSWRSRDYKTTETDPLTLIYQTTTHTIPAVDFVTGNVIQGQTVTIQARTYVFDVDGFLPSLPPPIMVWEKGLTLYMELVNDIDSNTIDDTGSFLSSADLNATHNGINIHTHGLHIDSFSDDSARNIPVGSSELIEFNLPADHGGGMNWYHPHIESTGEMLLGGGCWSGLQIETDPDGYEIPKEIHDLPSIPLLINKFFPEKLLDLKTGHEFALDPINGVFPRREITYPDFDMSFNDAIEERLGFAESSTNYVLVNGYLKPKILLVSGQWYRFPIVFVGGISAQFISDLKFRIGLNPELASNPEFSDYGPFFEVPGVLCETKLLAKDGVYLRESRDLDFFSGDRIWLAPANRAEIMVKCVLEAEDLCGTMDNTYALITDVPASSNRADNILESVAILQFEIHRRAEPVGDLASFERRSPDTPFKVSACLPKYNLDMTLPETQVTPHLAGLDSDTLQTIRRSTRDLNAAFPFLSPEDNFALNFEISPIGINGDFFRGYDLPESTLNFTVMQMQRVYQFTLRHGSHPLHIHINHMQLMNDLDDGSNYHKRGDYVDTLTSPCPTEGCGFANPFSPVEKADFRIYIDRFFDRKLAHCHIMSHSDSLALGEMFILEDKEYLANFKPPEFRDNCKEKLRVVDAATEGVDGCYVSGEADLMRIIVLAVACQLLVILCVYCMCCCEKKRKEKHRRESTVLESPREVLEAEVTLRKPKKGNPIKFQHGSIDI